MKVHIFEAMTKEEAEDYLFDFLAFGRNKAMQILEENLRFDIDLDFRIETLPEVLMALIPKLKTFPRKADPNVPEFIRNTEDYQKGLFDFDEQSNYVVLAAAYYLGETFVQRFAKLKWTIGNTDFREGNMPVISPFGGNDLEMAPILIVENLFRRIVKDDSRFGDVRKAIELWSKDVSN